MNSLKVTNWRGIESAPKDGKIVLLYFSDTGVTIGKWYKPGNPKHKGFWACAYHDKRFPTHWMPLPEAPNAKLTSGALAALERLYQQTTKERGRLKYENEQLAALQARVKELEDAFRELKSEAWLVPVQQLMYRGNNVVKRANEVLSTSTPGQALQRALLDARIDERTNNREFPNGISRASRLEELRAKRAELGG